LGQEGKSRDFLPHIFYPTMTRNSQRTTRRGSKRWQITLPGGFPIGEVGPLQLEIIGLLLLTTGILTLLSLLAVTHGTLSDAWAQLLRRVFGWGAYVTAFIFIGLGVWLAIRRFSAQRPVSWPRVLAGEMLFTSVLGMLHLGARPVDPWGLAQAGGGGGYVGWAISMGLANLLGTVVAGGVLGVIALVSLVLTLGISRSRFAGRVSAEAALSVRKTKEHRGATSQAEPVTQPQPSPEVLVETRRQIEIKTPLRPKSRSHKTVEAETQTPAAEAERLPPLDLLDISSPAALREAEIRERTRLIENTLDQFGVPARVVSIRQGPTVTQFGVEPGFVTRRGAGGRLEQRKVKVSRISALANDLALALAAPSIRIEAPVPGRPVVGIEVPNSKSSLVSLRVVMESEAFRAEKSALKLALGQDVAGNPVVADLASMPHLLIAGATGSGKSVCLNSIIACLLFTNPPENLQLLLVDPKRVELVNFNGIPHLIAPVVVETDQVVGALYWAVKTMEQRFDQFAQMGVRNIEGYNQVAIRRNLERMPYIIFIVDELADLMMLAPEEVERLVCRLAQMARATGIHLIIATQRPSVDVVTGLIKANFPARIAFAVTSQIDSRVILDQSGAEKLLGRGDMLYMAPDAPGLLRVQGTYVSDQELNKLVKFWKKARHGDGSHDRQPVPWAGMIRDDEDEDEKLIDQAVALVQRHKRASASFLQRQLRIGYHRAARLMEQLEDLGVVGPHAAVGRSREVLVGDYDDEEDDLTEDS